MLKKFLIKWAKKILIEELKQGIIRNTIGEVLYERLDRTKVQNKTIQRVSSLAEEVIIKKIEEL